MLHVGIVAEGSSDCLVLESIMKVIHNDIDFLRLQPDQTLAVTKPNGWRGVRAWCQEFGPNLDFFMRSVTPKLDLLIIHSDCSMADKENAEKPCPPAEATATSLREVILLNWLRLSASPGFVIIVTPSKSTDAWVVASLDPVYKKLNTIECDFAAEDELVKRRLLPRKDGEVKKQTRRYTPLANSVASHIGRVCGFCRQASVFYDEFSSKL